MLKSYYHLTKPGIIYGNALTAIAGFFLATKGRVDWLLLLWMLIGLSLIIGSACVFNNIIDRDIDQKMQRTKQRELVTGEVSKRNAIIYGIILGLIGITVLFFLTNVLTLGVALVGIIFYLGLYTPAKRQTVYSTLVGAVSGAVPPVVGYTSVTHRLDLAALLLFIILCLWEMPHFYAIAIYRLKDYAEAGLPVLSVRYGVKNSKIQIFIYILAFDIAAASLSVFGYAGDLYLYVMGFVSVMWLVMAARGFRQGIDDTRWARKVFLFSLIVILAFSFMTSINNFLSKF